MSEKKSVELPGQTGRWELSNEGVVHVGQSSMLLASEPGRYLVYRSLAEGPTFPKLVPGDAIEFKNLALVVVNPRLKMAADVAGTCVDYDEALISLVYREGACIWQRAS